MQSDNLVQFTNISKMVLGRKTPLKEKDARYNQAKFMKKCLQNANMNRSRFLNRYRQEKQKQLDQYTKNREIF